MLDINIDIDEIVKEFKGYEKKLTEALKDGVKALAHDTHAHVLEQAANGPNKLRTRLEEYKNNLKMIENNDIYTIQVPDKIMWIEEGMEPHSMLPDLLASPKAKTSKDGGKYIVVPFKHNKGPTQQTPFAQSITEMLKNNLKKMKIPYGSIERDSSGAAKLGKLHRIDMGGPKRPHWTSPILDGVSIYQHQKKNPDGSLVMNKSGPAIQRDIMTFRTASSKHEGTGKWDHPGLEGKHFLDEAYEWALKEWEEKLLPQIIKSVVGE